MDGEFVVFLIGMRVNRWWRPDVWLPIAMSMRRMLRELEARPDSGFLGYQEGFGNPTMMVQYWRSAEQLFAYARAKDGAHFPAWVDFKRRAAKTGVVGIWHETYLVSPGRYESIYHHMPPFGLGRVGELVPATGHRARAADRVREERRAA